MNNEQKMNPDLVLAAANKLIGICQRNGLVLTIETVNRKPLAMGNYEMVAQVREARVSAKPAERNAPDIDAMCEQAMRLVNQSIAVSVRKHEAEMNGDYLLAVARMKVRHLDMMREQLMKRQADLAWARIAWPAVPPYIRLGFQAGELAESLLKASKAVNRYLRGS